MKMKKKFNLDSDIFSVILTQHNWFNLNKEKQFHIIILLVGAYKDKMYTLQCKIFSLTLTYKT